MHEAKSLVIPLSQQAKFFVTQCPKTDEEMKQMLSVPYSNAVGSVMYMMICTRPDLAYAISILSRYMSNPGREHWEGLKGVLRYIKGSADCGLLFEKNGIFKGDPLRGYVDADYAANIDCRRSQTGYIFTLYGTAIS
ncbi:secreted RxLR effector protein 161-like [Salvia miltiorrhiza]|uniref:secreted RxLR effector protein 161-like n=1 Tax=Salvia miltiorrhiza TaxID=226208 RepID=UPI0025ACA664|nr:secreted RxLR effector protein 161-like [Salvia miltiorrhiza]